VNPRLVAAATALAALALSSCSITSNDAASVGGTSLSIRDFESHLEELAVAQPSQLFNPNGSLSADTARSLLSLWVSSEILSDIVAAEGGSVTDEDRQAVRDNFEANPDLADLADETKDWLIGIEATEAAYVRTAEISPETTREVYELGPAVSGVLCLRGFIAPSAEQAEDAVARFAAGESFADLADEISPDGDPGGVIVDPQTGAECISPDLLQNPDLVAALSSTDIGEASPVVDLGGGFAVLLQRPFDEVADAVTTAVASQLAVQQRSAAIADAEGVTVSSRYGRWDGELGAVVALS
jgi:DNA-directed RNA polymerase subunit F